MTVDDRLGGTGIKNTSDHCALTRRTVYRDALTSTDTTVTGIEEVIDLRASRIGYRNAIVLFVQLLNGASSVTLELYENVMYPLPYAIPALVPEEDDSDWALVASITAITSNKVVRIPAGFPDLSAGLYKLKVTAITPGAGGSVRISEAHTG